MTNESQAASMTDYSKVKVGDTVWWSDVNGRGLRPESGTVLKVGPKLITVSRYSRTIVFRRATGRTNNEYSHQHLIVDLELHDSENKANSAMATLRYRMGQRLPGVTHADIQAAAKLLKINIE